MSRPTSADLWALGDPETHDDYKCPNCWGTLYALEFEDGTEDETKLACAGCAIHWDRPHFSPPRYNQADAEPCGVKCGHLDPDNPAAKYQTAVHWEADLQAARDRNPGKDVTGTHAACILPAGHTNLHYTPCRYTITTPKEGATE